MHRINLKVTLASLFLLLMSALLPNHLAADQIDDPALRPLVFGTLPLEKPSKLFERYHGLVKYFQTKLGRPVRFEVGKDYNDSISKFQSGHYDFGYIGPAPYLNATRKDPQNHDVLRIIGTIATNGKPYYMATIVARRENTQINKIKDLQGKKFAFGSRESTLSFYLPAKMLFDAGIWDSIEYSFLGKHDTVVNAVTNGAFDAGAIKEDIASGANKELKVIAISEPVWDFLLVTHKSMDNDLFLKIKGIALQLKDQTILEKIKPGVTGFVASKDRNYDNLWKIIENIDARVPHN